MSESERSPSRLTGMDKIPRTPAAPSSRDAETGETSSTEVTPLLKKQKQERRGSAPMGSTGQQLPTATTTETPRQTPSVEDKNREAWSDRTEAIQSAKAAVINALLKEQLTELLEGYTTARLNFPEDPRMPFVHIVVPQFMLRKHSDRFRKLLQSGYTHSFRNDLQISIVVFISWALDKNIPSITDEVKRALHNHGRCYRSEWPEKYYDEIALPFEGAELVALWCFGDEFGAVDFQNATMCEIVRDADGSDCLDLARTFLDWQKKLASCHTAHQQLCGILRRVLAYKSWFLLCEGKTDHATTIRGIVGGEVYEEASQALDIYHRNHEGDLDSPEHRGCLKDHMDKFMVVDTGRPT